MSKKNKSINPVEGDEISENEGGWVKILRFVQIIIDSIISIFGRASKRKKNQ